MPGGSEITFYLESDRVLSEVRTGVSCVFFFLT